MPVIGSVICSVESGSHCVGGRSGTHWLVAPRCVPAPHAALPTMSFAGTHAPFMSIVPVPHVGSLQPAWVAPSTATAPSAPSHVIQLVLVMGGLLEVRPVVG